MFREKERHIVVHGNADKEREIERPLSKENIWSHPSADIQLSKHLTLVVEIVSGHISPSVYKTFPLVPDYIICSNVLFILTPNGNGENLVKKKR